MVRSKQNNGSKVEQDTRTIEHDTTSNLLLDQSLKVHVYNRKRGPK